MGNSAQSLWNTGRFCIQNINGYWDENILTIHYDKNDIRKYEYLGTNNQGEHHLKGVDHDFENFLPDHWFSDRNLEIPIGGRV